MTRRLVPLAIAAVLLAAPASASAAGQPAAAPPAVVADAEPVPVKAVSWKVDHATRTITATVRIQLGSMCTRAEYAHLATRGTGWKQCLVTQRIVDTIRAQIDKVWNQGLKYRCYRVKVEVDIKVLNELDGPVAQSAKAPGDRVHIAIDQTPGTARSSVQTTTPPAGAAWNSRRPSDTLTPVNGGDTPSTWRYPPTGSRGLYAHELGHVLGLDDGYADDAQGNSVTRPDAPANDTMTDDDITAVDPSTVQLLVERAGIDDWDLRCDYTADGTAAGGTVKGTKCGGIEGDWVATTEVTDPIGTMKQTVTITATKEGDGRFVMREVNRAEMPGYVTTSTDKATGTGYLVFEADGTAAWKMKDVTHIRDTTAVAGGQRMKLPREKVPLIEWVWKWYLADSCPSG